MWHMLLIPLSIVLLVSRRYRRVRWRASESRGDQRRHSIPKTALYRDGSTPDRRWPSRNTRPLPRRPLLLGVNQSSANGEGRPAGADRPAPEFLRLRLDPVGSDLDAVRHAVAMRSTESGRAGACGVVSGNGLNLGLSIRYGS